MDNGSVRERDHSVLHVETLLANAVRSRPLPGCALVDRRSREQSIGSPFHFGQLRRASSPVPAGTSRSVVFLSDVPSAEHEAVLQVEEEGVMSAVVEMRCGAAYKCKYRLYREGRPLDKEEDNEVSPS